jgi:hypothetical protein
MPNRVRITFEQNFMSRESKNLNHHKLLTLVLQSVRGEMNFKNFVPGYRKNRADLLASTLTGAQKVFDLRWVVAIIGQGKVQFFPK